MRLAVVGTGAIGGYFGGRLAAHGHDVSFVARGDHLRALRRDGLAVQSVAGSFTVQPVRATDDPHEIGVVDHVLLCVKTWQLPPAIDMLAPLLGPGSAVVTLQNGVDAPEQVAAAVGRDTVLPGIAKIFAFLDGPGRVSHGGGPASLTFAEWDSRPSDRVQQLRAALTESGVTAVTPADIWVELWSKFVFVVPLGSLGAATGVPVGVLRSRPGLRQLLADAMAEIERVGRAHGIGLPDDIVATTMGFLDHQPESGTTSLQRDILADLPSELDAWTGAVARLGAQTATATPIHSVLYEVLSLRGSH